MPEFLAGTADYPDGTEAAYYREQDAQDRVSAIRVTVPEGHSAVLRVDIYRASGGVQPGTYQVFFPGASLTDAGALAPAGGSNETVTLPHTTTPAWQWSDSLSTWR